MSGLIHWVGETTSTNSLLRHEADKGALPEFYTLCADYQTSGRGQVGNTWESERGRNLLLSTLLLPDGVDVSKQFFVSMAVALSVVDAVTPLLERQDVRLAGQLKVKWPNDIYVADKKLAGILIENRLSGRGIADTIVGLGLNVNQDVFLSDAPNPVSLKNLTETEYDIHAVANDFLSCLQLRMAQLREGTYAELLQEYMQRLFRCDGGYHPFADANGRFAGRIMGVMPDGRLLLTDDQGASRSYLFKEVEFII